LGPGFGSRVELKNKRKGEKPPHGFPGGGWEVVSRGGDNYGMSCHVIPDQFRENAKVNFSQKIIMKKRGRCTEKRVL